VCDVVGLVREPELVVSPGSPFIASRGGRYLHEGVDTVFGRVSMVGKV